MVAKWRRHHHHETTTGAGGGRGRPYSLRSISEVYGSDTVTKAQLGLLFSIKIFNGKSYMHILMKVIFKANL
jgi:hypothetical protein